MKSPRRETGGGFLRGAITYEQSGADRARCGERLLDTLAQRLQQGGFKRVEARVLRRFRQFYLAYPQIRETLSPESGSQLFPPAIRQTLAATILFAARVLSACSYQGLCYPENG